MLYIHTKTCNVRWFCYLVLQNPSKEKVYLSGYGVELAIKSTEYKAKDDTQVKGEFLLKIRILYKNNLSYNKMVLYFFSHE